MELWISLLLFFLTGAISGAFGGMLGIGGATILVPTLTLVFGLPIYLAIGISLLNNVAVSLTATLRYHSRGLLNRRIILLLSIGSIGGILIGTYLATKTTGSFLKVLFGIFLLFIIANAIIHRNAVEYDRLKDPAKEQEAGMTGLGFVMGMLGALLGIGGGTIAVPVLNTIFRVPLKNAIANSLATIILSSSLGAIIYFALSSGSLFSAEDALITAITIIPGSIVGARVGVKISEYVPTKHIKYIFYAMLLYIAYNMIKSGMGW